MNILITGGHLTPALAMCDYIRTHQVDDKIVFVGRRYSQDRAQQLAHEYQEVTARNLRFVPFWSPRLQLGMNMTSVLFPFQLIVACVRAMVIIIKEHPSVVLSFGGYLAVPIAVAAWCLRVPVVTHEQTRVVGTANKVIAKLAKTIAVTFEETIAVLPAGKKIVVTGNPLRPELLAANPSKPDWIANTVRKPVLYITGGNQGSQVINTLVEQTLPALSKSWLVIHQCGNKSNTTNYRQQLEKARTNLPRAQQSSYYVFEWLPETELAWVYQNAQIAVARSGANTLMELIAFRLPSLVIPLPFSHADEQVRNAEWLSQMGGGVVVPQREATPDRFLSALTYVKNHRADFAANLRQVELPRDAAANLYALLQSSV